MTAPTPIRTTFTRTIKGVNVRIVCGARLPRLLGKAGITLRYPRVVQRSGFPFRDLAMTNVIFLAPEPMGVTPALLAHEFCHVLQWHKGFWKFVGRYVWGLIRYGYGLKHPLEKNAHDYAASKQGEFALDVQLMQALS